MDISVFFYMQNLFGIVVSQRSMLNWRRAGVSLPWVYVHSAIYQVFWCRGVA